MAASYLIGELADIEREITRVADDLSDWDDYNLLEGRDKMRELASRVAVQVERLKSEGRA